MKYILYGMCLYHKCLNIIIANCLINKNFSKIIVKLIYLILSQYVCNVAKCGKLLY